MLLNFKEAFTFMFKDEKFWQKYIVGIIFCALILIPSWIMYPKLINGTLNPLLSMGISFLAMLLGLFLYGFAILYSNLKITLKQDILPEWSKDFGKITKTGLKYIFGGLAYGITSFIALLPIFIILSIIAIIIVGVISAPSIASMGPNFNPNDPYYMGRMAGIGLISAVIMFLLFLPVIIVWITSVYLSIISFCTDLNFKSFFNLKRMWSLLRGNVLNLVILIGISFAYSILCQVFIKLLGYNIYFTIALIICFYTTLVWANLNAQFALISIEKNAKLLEEKKEQENSQENPQ